MLKGIHLQRQVFEVHFSFLRVRIVAIHAIAKHEIEMLLRHDSGGQFTQKVDGGQG